MTAHWEVVISFLLGVITILLGLIAAQNKRLTEKIETKLDVKVDDSHCAACSARTDKAIDAIWAAFNGHINNFHLKGRDDG